MQDCFRQHPEMYGSELEDDEDELEEELRADASSGGSDAPNDMMTSANGQPSPQEVPKPAVEVPGNTTKSIKAGDEGGNLVPRVAHDAASKP